jgi:hypothetical protein
VADETGGAPACPVRPAPPSTVITGRDAGGPVGDGDGLGVATGGQAGAVVAAGAGPDRLAHPAAIGDRPRTPIARP